MLVVVLVRGAAAAAILFEILELFEHIVYEDFVRVQEAVVDFEEYELDEELEYFGLEVNASG